MPEIFISYRRDDSLSAVGRLADRLVENFGIDQVFRDLDAIEAGADFERAILDSVRAATVLLVVIGQRWSDARALDGRRRLDDPGDFVRREIQSAFESNIAIVPVLVEGASMPNADSLPEPLHTLARRQAFELSETRWAYDCGRLIRHLEQGLAIETISPDRPEKRGKFAAARLSFREAFVSAIVNYVPDLLGLLARPKRMIAKRNFGRERDFAYALTFLALSLLLADLLVLGAWPTDDLSIPMFLFSGLVFGTASMLLLSLPLYGAWRLVGAPHGYYRIAVPLCYQTAIGWLSFMASGVVMLTAADLNTPNTTERIRAILMAGSGAWQDRLQDAAEVLRVTSPEAMIGMMLVVLMYIGLGGWLIGSWGAYRQASGLSRWRSALAGVLFALFAVVPLEGLILLARFLAAP